MSVSSHHSPCAPMERVLFNLHHQMCTAALAKTTSKSRNLVERTILILSVCTFGVLLLTHLSFVYRGGISGVDLDWTSRQSHQHATNTAKIPPSTTQSTTKNIPLQCFSTIQGFSTDADITHVSLLQDYQEGLTLSSSSRAVLSSADTVTNNAVDDVCQSAETTAFVPDSRILLSYSKVKGFLLLPMEVCRRRGIVVQHVMVSPSDAHCFGEPFLRKLVFGLIGPDTVVLNWLLATFANRETAGFVYNPRTDVVIDLSLFNIQSNNNYNRHDAAQRTTTAFFDGHSFHNKSSQWGSWRNRHEFLVSKLAIVLKTTFLFFITTTLVSFTLRETQERMLDFTHQLQAHVRSHRPVFQLVTTHLVDNLVFVPIMVGMIFFLIEFYRGDKFLAFMVVSLVWLCEVFSAVSLRSSQGIHFFPRIFFLLFSLFHFYLFSFPFGFAYTALASTVFFMTHSMLFFFFRYELPAIALGLVTVEQPRMGIPSASSARVSVPSLETERTLAPTTNDENPDNVIQAPSLVSVHLPRRHPSQHSMITASSGRLSRPTSSGGLFHRGGDGDDDDGDGSYMYFMDGEIVMHSRRAPSPFTIGSGSYVPGPQSTGSTSLDDSQNSSTSHRLNDAGLMRPSSVLVLDGLSDSVSAERLDALLQPGSNLAPEESTTDRDCPVIGRTPADPPETSALQAILQANKTTPRIENLSLEARYRDEQALVSSAPTFPHLGSPSRAP